MGKPPQTQPPGSQRLDRWLWVARFFKTRNLAIEAIRGGKVQVDGQRVKPARALHQGARDLPWVGAVDQLDLELG